MGNATEKKVKSLLIKIWPLLVIVALWIVFSFPYLAKGLVPFPSDYLVTFFPPWSAQYGMPVKNNAMPDIITQIYPWKKLTIDTWKSGNVPLWNPYSFSGTPHAGNYQSAVFSPFNLLFFLLPFVSAWSVLILLQPLLAGLFMYVFVRELDKSKVSSLISSVAFMFCGFMVVWMEYGTLGYSALFLPLIFWGIHRYSQKTSRGALIAVSAGLALSFLSGHLQTSLYVLGASVFFALWITASHKLWRQGMVLFGAIVVGLLLAAPQILIGLHSFLNSTRGISILKGEIIPWQYLVTLIAPDFYGNPVTRNDWFGHYAEWAGFIGVIPLMLAVYAVTKKTLREGLFFTGLAVITLLLALPTPLNDLLYILKIPVLSGSAASRIIVITSFSMAALTAYGFDAMVADWNGRNWKKIIIFCALFLTLIGIIWATLILKKPFDAVKLSIATHNFVIPSIFTISGVLLFVFGLMRNGWVRRSVILLVVVASVVDVFRFAYKWIPFESSQYIYPEPKSLAYLESHVGFDRVFGNIGAGEVGTQFHLPLVEGYDAVYQARYGEFINAVSKGYVYPGGRSVVQFDKNGLYKTEALQLLGIRYIYHRFSDGRNVWTFPYWEYLDRGTMHQVYSDEQYEVFEYNNVYPRAFLASSYKIATTDKDIIDVLFAKEFDRRNTLVLEAKPQIEPQEGSGSATIVSYKPNSVQIETDSPVDKLLFLSDVYDSGWQVAVDGKLSPILRADYDFRAVALPTGKHVVEFRYHPEEFRWGIILTIVGIAGLAFLVKRK